MIAVSMLACEDLGALLDLMYHVAVCSACSEAASKLDLGLSAEGEGVVSRVTSLWPQPPGK